MKKTVNNIDNGAGAVVNFSEIETSFTGLEFKGSGSATLYTKFVELQSPEFVKVFGKTAKELGAFQIIDSIAVDFTNKNEIERAKLSLLEKLDKSDYTEIEAGLISLTKIDNELCLIRYYSLWLQVNFGVYCLPKQARKQAKLLPKTDKKVDKKASILSKLSNLEF